MGVAMSKCLSNLPEVRVSSAKIKSTDFSVAMARRVMSSKFPMGVGIIYSFISYNFASKLQSLTNYYDYEVIK